MSAVFLESGLPMTDDVPRKTDRGYAVLMYPHLAMRCMMPECVASAHGVHKEAHTLLLNSQERTGTAYARSVLT